MFKKTVIAAFALISTTALAADPVLLSAVSRKVHGSNGTFDIALSEQVSTIEPRLGPVFAVVFNYNQAIEEAECYFAEGAGTMYPALIHNSTVTCQFNTPYTGLWVSVDVVVRSVHNTYGESLVRMGLLPGDVNGDCRVTTADKALVNANVAQFITSTNFRYDVNANGYLTVSDVGITNARIGTFLP